MSVKSGNTGTCAGVTASVGSGTISMASGSTLPAGGCNIVVGVTSSTVGTSTNTLAANALSTGLGSYAFSTGATLTIYTPRTYWDGPASNQTTIEGGNGTWSGTGQNWTTSSGTPNGIWDGGTVTATATFQGSAGTVTIAEGYNASIGGISFGTTGYTIARTTSGTLALAQNATIATTASGFSETISAPVTGSFGITWSPTTSGTLTLKGANTYTGATTISAGTLQLGDGTVTGNIIPAANSITDNAALIYNTPSIISHSGIISGSGTFEKKGSGALTLSGGNIYSGATTISAGTLQLGDGTATGNIILAANSITDNAALIYNTPSTISHSGPISGSGTVEKKGSGTLTLSGANIYTGTTTVSAGSLNVNGSTHANSAVTVSSSGTLGGTGTVGGVTTVNTGATLSPGVAGTTPVGSLNIGNNLTLNSGSFTAFDLAETGTLGGTCNDKVAVTGNLALAGTLTVTKSDGVSGCASTFQKGTYRLFTYTGTRSGTFNSVTLPAGYVGRIDTSVPYEVRLVVDSTTYWDGAGPAGNGTVDGGNGTWNGSNTNWTTSDGLINGTWPGGTATFGGTTGGGVTIENGYTASVGGLTFSTSGYTLSPSVSGNGTLELTQTATVNVTGTATISAPISGTNFGLTKTNTGTLTLSGANSYTGATTLSAGTLVLNHASALSGGGNLTFAGGVLKHSSNNKVDYSARIKNSTLGAIRIDTDTQDVTYASGLASSNTGGLTKQGSGSLTLSGTNAYTGATTVNAGRLNINGSTGTSSTVTVSSSGTLGGTGTVGGATTVYGTLSPGLSPGTLTFSNGLTLDAAASSVFELAQAGTAGGLCNDKVAVTGNLTLAGTLTISKADGATNCSSTFGAGTYTLFTYTGSRSGSFSSVTLPSGYFGRIDTSETGTVKLVVSAAADLTWWDGAGTTANDSVDGGDGTWSANGNNWTSSSGSFNNTWPGSASVANFSKVGGNVSVSGTQSIGGLNFAVSGYTLANGTLSAAASSTLTVVSGTATVNSAISDAATLLTKDGAGTLVLGGTNNYTGATAVSAGTLQLGADSALPVTGAVSVAGSATLNLNGKSQTLSGGLTVGGTLALGSNGNLTLSGGTSSIAAITGSGTITVNSGATLTLSAAISNTGVVVKLAGGTLALGNLTHTLGGLDVTGSSTLDFGSGNATLTVSTLSATANLAVTNWTKGNDSFYATAVTGNPARETANVSPLNKLTFSGYTAADTRWTTQNEITPVQGLTTLSGKLFNDGGAPSGGTNSGTPNNGIQDGNEAGLSGGTLALSDCSSTLSSATSDAAGAYTLSVPVDRQGNTACVTTTLPSGYVATGVNVGGTAIPDGMPTAKDGVTYSYTRASNRLSFTMPTGKVLSVNFGAVPASTFLADSQMRATIGGVATYKHTFSAGTGGTLTLSTLNGTPTPSSVTGWSESIYGANCSSGAVDSSPFTSATVTQGQVVCFVMNQRAPGTATDGNTYSVQVRAQLAAANASPALNWSYTVTDLTTVSSSQVLLEKRGRNVTDSGSFGTALQAGPGSVIEYEIKFTNNGASPVSNLVIQDSATGYVTWQKTGIATVPSGMTCVVTTPLGSGKSCVVEWSGSGTGNLVWTFTGNFNPGATGTVTYQVKVNQ